MAIELAEGMKWLTHNGLKMLYIDYTGLAGQAFIDRMNTYSPVLIELGKETDGIYLITDVTGASFSDGAFRQASLHGKILKPFLKAMAAIGTTGLKKSMLTIFGVVSSSPVKGFDTVEEAMEWLSAQAAK